MFETATGYSSRVRLELQIDGETHLVAQVGRGQLILKDDPKSEIHGFGELIISIDDEVEIQPVFLSTIEGRRLSYG